jgi:HK97 gp10 family phage protein
MSIKIKNLKKIQYAMMQSPRITAKYMQEAIERSIEQVVDATVPITPYKTGRLRTSIGEGKTFGLLWGKITPKVHYAIYVHEGTRYMRARPFLKRGAEKAQSQIQKNFEFLLDKALKEIARKAR